MEKLKADLEAMAERILPSATPGVPSIPLAFDTSAPQLSRSNLQGALIGCEGGLFVMVPDVESPLGPFSKKLSISDSR